MKKRPFTVRTVNRLLEQAQRRGRYAELVAEATADLRSFLGERFLLTPTQQKVVAGLPQAQLDAVAAALDQSAAAGKRAEFKMGTFEDDRPQAAGIVIIVIEIDIIIARLKTLDDQIASELQELHTAEGV